MVGPTRSNNPTIRQNARTIKARIATIRCRTCIAGGGGGWPVDGKCGAGPLAKQAMLQYQAEFEPASDGPKKLAEAPVGRPTMAERVIASAAVCERPTAMKVRGGQ